MPGLVIETCRTEFSKLKSMAERAMEQLTWDQCQVQINKQQNSVAAIVKHIAGNSRSRWTDFLNSDGEKSDRNREAEFHPDYATREEMMKAWEAGWQCLYNALDGLSDDMLSRSVYIRQEPHTVFAAINRQTSHYAYHVGQICLIAKHVKGDDWQYLTIPPGQSDAFNRKMGMR